MRAGAIVLALAALASFPCAGGAAELPSQAKKPKPPETARAVETCNIGGVVGVVAANGVCVRLSGYISVGVAAGTVK